MSDPYKVLGVARNADQDTIKSAYRKLAKKYHPDLNQGDDSVAKKFQEVSTAYDLLGDPDKRKRYDRGDLDPDGRERGGRSSFWRKGWKARSGRSDSSTGSTFDFSEDFDADSIDEILKQWRGAKSTAGPGGSAGESSDFRTTTRRSSQDLRYRLKVPFTEAVNGIKKHVTLSDGKVVNLTIPPATESGTRLRLKGKGKPAKGGLPAGDAYLELQVEAHPYFERDGKDILLNLPVTLSEALLGATVTVPTVHGNVSLKIPKGSNSGQKMRLRGKGVPAIAKDDTGDQYVTLKVVLPSEPDEELVTFVEKWAAGHGYNPRKHLE